MSTPEFTLTLFRRDLTSYTAWVRFRSGLPGDDEERSDHEEFQLGATVLNRTWPEPAVYGAALTAAVFVGKVRDLWIVAKERARAQPALRFRQERTRSPRQRRPRGSSHSRPASSP